MSKVFTFFVQFKGKVEIMLSMKISKVNSNLDLRLNYKLIKLKVLKKVFQGV